MRRLQRKGEGDQGNGQARELVQRTASFKLPDKFLSELNAASGGLEDGVHSVYRVERGNPVYER
ncbi:hypothetical protein PI124_g22787 [Phytophthora idaei]|nr:hypothetical protein PI125_g13685 [Phytophthora idaei]KAG3125695.1 hypothetical protein PI126_g22651 [Phytophthora idaei]KAG3232125.1 hypothetical protein PI124_g22787 [Phytophthora idaei]